MGVGQVPTGKFPDRSALEQAIDVCVQAINESGLHQKEISYLLPTSHFASPRFNTDLIFSGMVEELGLAGTLKGNMMCCSGGASSSMQMKTAVAYIASGMANAVLCFHTEKTGTGLTGEGVIDFFSTTGISGDWETPYGMHFSPISGLIMERYMYESGTTDEEMAAVCVSNRNWAMLNPDAMFRKSLTIDDVLQSKMISTPMHSFESNMLGDGASAFLIVNEELAAKCESPVWILGTGSCVTHFTLSQEPDIGRFSYKKASDAAYAEAGITPQDIDIWEIYDSYPQFELIGLEEMGACKRGEAGKLFLTGETSPGGRFPTTTNGGMLSQGHTAAGGGHAILVETYRQLAGKAGERQVPNAKYAIETGTGGTYMDVQVAILGKECA
ncbi:hypothetical protein AGMMS49983_21790 [Clostridia bacterium]|nr:hypothetical protein AGMMS49983_21790 [Clostridia bacterium]